MAGGDRERRLLLAGLAGHESGRPPAHHTNGPAFQPRLLHDDALPAQHMGSGLGLAGWACGLIMGMRVFRQQGSSCWAAPFGDRDRLSPRHRLRAAWCAPSASVLLGWAESLPILLLAAALTGFAGALFTPAPRPILCQRMPHPEPAPARLRPSTNLRQPGGRRARPLWSVSP